jgi:hypothetical protein
MLTANKITSTMYYSYDIASLRAKLKKKTAYISGKCPEQHMPHRREYIFLLTKKEGVIKHAHRLCC